ncbi:unnamed protein product, partial [Ectocarpus fasciculatus]
GRIKTLTSGQTVTDFLGTAADVDTYAIEGSVGDRLFLSFGESVGTTTYNPGVFIFNPDGTLLTGDSSESDGHAFSNVEMTQSGTYKVVIRDSQLNLGGAYTMTAVVIDDT